jgi:hypothetical protein
LTYSGPTQDGAYRYIQFTAGTGTVTW